MLAHRLGYQCIMIALMIKNGESTGKKRKFEHSCGAYVHLGGRVLVWRMVRVIKYL